MAKQAKSMNEGYVTCENCPDGMERDSEFKLELRSSDGSLIDHVYLCEECALNESWSVSADGNFLECD